MSVKRLALVVLAAVGAIAATASPAFALSATADTTWMTNGKAGTVRALAVSADGSMLFVGGTFNAVDGVAVKNFAVVSPSDGSLIAGFQHKFNTAVHVIKVGSSLVYV